ncbi:hypothetical protein ACHAPT_008849 [Fusarium lateritium]
MGDNIDWTGFSAFANTLSVASLSTPQAGPNLEARIATAAANFRTWLDNVRNNPQAHGFSNAPVNYAEAVVRLLDAFFPAGGRAVLFNTGPPPPALGGPPVIQPIMVPFGAVPNGQIGISDGASALGYLFSVVSYPQNLQPTWENYFLPLTVLYSWSVYLAFITYGPNMPVKIDAVPNMSCIMYLPRGNSPPYFFLGHTKAREANAPNDKRDNANCLHYRASLIQRAAQTGGRPPIPKPTDQLKQQMKSVFFENLPGKVTFDANAEVFLKPVFQDFANAPGGKTSLKDIQQVLMNEIKDEYAVSSTPMTWRPNNIASVTRLWNTLTAEKMASAVSELVEAYLEDEDREELWITLLKAYISPRITVPRIDGVNPSFDPEKPVPIPPVSQLTINALVDAFFADHKDVLEAKLSKIIQLCQGIPTEGLVGATEIAREQRWIDQFRKDVTDDYGRCAETLCAYGISNVFYPQTFVTATDGPAVRGIALETRKLGQGAAELNLFGTGFDTDAMEEISQARGSVYRLPCDDFCSTMLKHVQMRDSTQKLLAYDIDLYAVPKLTAVPPP